jgi:SAM-dependent methyltransferase
MKLIIKTALQIRKYLVPKIWPSANYFLPKRRLSPLSDKFGFDRGTPIDRFWIDQFMKSSSQDIRGDVLEIGDSRYSNKQKSNIKKLDILDINKNNKEATIIGDLRNLRGVIKSNSYDCIILTQVLGMIDDIVAVISECHRILKPGGIILATSSSLAPTLSPKQSYWRFTKQSMQYLFSKKFKSLHVQSYGNALTGQCFWVGLAQEEMKKEELLFNDPRFECLVAVRATK